MTHQFISAYLVKYNKNPVWLYIMGKFSEANAAPVQGYLKILIIEQGECHTAVWKHDGRAPPTTWTYGPNSHIFSLHNKYTKQTCNILFHPTVAHKSCDRSLALRKRYLPTVPCAVSWISMNWSLKLCSLWDSILHLSNLTRLGGGMERQTWVSGYRIWDMAHSCLQKFF